MKKNLLLLFLTVTVFVAVITLPEAECKRVYTSSGSRNRGSSSSSSYGSSSSSRSKSKPSSGGFFSFFGGSKSSPNTRSKTVPTTAQRNWQTATNHAQSHSSNQKTGSSNSGWANPYYKPSAPAVPSAPKTTNYGWKPASQPSSNVGSAHPSSNVGGSKPYPSQTANTGVQQSSYNGFKPAPSLPNTHATNLQTPQTNYAASKPVSSVPVQNTGYQPSSYNTHSAPSSGGFGGYHPPSNVHNNYYHPSQGSHNVPHQAPSYQQSGYHSSSYPQQSYSGHHPPQNNFGYSPAGGGYSGSPSYQGNKFYSGNSGQYGYPGGGNWGVPTYGTKKSSSGTGKLLTGLAVGAAGGYLTNSLINSISNPWRYSGHGYGSGFGYGSSLGYGGVGLGSGLGVGYGTQYLLSKDRDESAFERGYVRGFKDRQEEKNKETQNSPAPSPTPEDDPTSKWIHCVAYDPQTQQTLINPNCSCTVTTSVDDRTGQPISAHHCTTLNGLVMRPIPIVNNQPVLPPSPDMSANSQPSTGVNSPGVVPSYVDSYQGGGQYGVINGQAFSIPKPKDSNENQNLPTPNIDVRISEPPSDKTPGETPSSGKTPDETSSSGKTPDETPLTSDVKEETKEKEKTSGTVPNLEVVVPTSSQNITNVETDKETIMGEHLNVSSTSIVSTEKINSDTMGIEKKMDDEKNADEFFGKLQKIVNMGNFVDWG